MMQITIWDTNTSRIVRLEENLNHALAAFGESALVLLESEAPRIARHNLYGKTPVLEIDGSFWMTEKVNEIITKEEMVSLLKAVFNREPKHPLK